MNELRAALELATEEELQDLTSLLFQRKFNPLDYLRGLHPDRVQSRDRTTWLNALEQRFRFLAADGLTVLKGRTGHIDLPSGPDSNLSAPPPTIFTHARDDRARGRYLFAPNAAQLEEDFPSRSPESDPAHPSSLGHLIHRPVTDELVRGASPSLPRGQWGTGGEFGAATHVASTDCPTVCCPFCHLSSGPWGSISDPCDASRPPGAANRAPRDDLNSSPLWGAKDGGGNGEFSSMGRIHRGFRLAIDLHELQPCNSHGFHSGSDSLDSWR